MRTWLTYVCLRTLSNDCTAPRSRTVWLLDQTQSAATGWIDKMKLTICSESTKNINRFRFNLSWNGNERKNRERNNQMNTIDSTFACCSLQLKNTFQSRGIPGAGMMLSHSSGTSKNFLSVFQWWFILAVDHHLRDNAPLRFHYLFPRLSRRVITWSY